MEPGTGMCLCCPVLEASKDGEEWAREEVVHEVPAATGDPLGSGLAFALRDEESVEGVETREDDRSYMI